MTIEMSDLESIALGHLSRTQIIVDTCQLIVGRGENPGETESETVRWLTMMCERIGARVTLQEFAPGRENLHAVLGPEDGPAILFLGHSDVVPAGDGWTANPFAPRVTDEAIIGRGSADMKGGLAAIIGAMEAINLADPGLRLELLCTGDEEDRSLGVQAALEVDSPRPFLACIVAEPTNLEIVIGCRGASNFFVQIVGSSAHAGRPEDGANSIYGASQLVNLVRERHDKARREKADELLGGVTWNVGTVSGGTGTSMVARETVVTIDRRTLPGEDPAEILTDFLSEFRDDLASSGIVNVEKLEVTGSVDMAMPGFRVDPDAPVVRIAQRALIELGVSGHVTGWSAACEGGFLSRFHQTPTIVLGPGDVNNQAHQPNEEVPIDQLVLAARTYVLIALRLSEQAWNEQAWNEQEHAEERMYL